MPTFWVSRRLLSRQLACSLMQMYERGRSFAVATHRRSMCESTIAISTALRSATRDAHQVAPLTSLLFHHHGRDCALQMQACCARSCESLLHLMVRILGLREDHDLSRRRELGLGSGAWVGRFSASRCQRDLMRAKKYVSFGFQDVRCYQYTGTYLLSLRFSRRRRSSCLLLKLACRSIREEETV